ncbi:hypothetical protein J32TS6_31450 [Virgibacillus pantothenticus]|uniref:hypothetical protein n=1 Tax=Virgibacillus pantothenticus TaxID=1473 RepID=UPI001AFDF8FE|nr:hypothetical protein [Virgibacillus pantothenticus]GIP64590.1 hypothetical protein J32TS6_31450 [Virgibacillus pantothenticus]
MKLIKNNRAILRIAGVKTNEFKSLNNLESIYFKLEKEQLRIERKINDLSIILDNLLYKNRKTLTN